jgi:acetyl-CoA carboxylase biotin carboxylase subunit
MFSRLLIANRGEIALRIIRACRELGVESVVVHSKADEGAHYLELADDAICIGPGPSAQSYLSIPNIISAAEIADVDAVHPGYGFLSENAHFAEVCRANNIEFVGPNEETIRRVGDKAEAKSAAQAAGIPVVEGSEGPVASDDEALEVARRVGYPVLIKAVSGGGGRGMRVAHNDIALQVNIQTARSEAEAAFGDPSVYVEKYLDNPRHVEVQILADKQGNVIHLGDRDCSVQRRHQKVIEEGPSPGVPSDVRTKMGRAAVRLAKQVGYHGAGTVEFLYENRRWYFMEVNARIQVEHPVTELITGIDLVKEQLRLAAGEPLGRKQQQVRTTGHAIECRVNAEDPARGFAPSPGRVTQCILPGGPGVRVDTHVSAGYWMPPYYDSMIAKLLVWADTREEALVRMRGALDEYRIEGIHTNLDLHRRILRNAYFKRGEYTTRFLDELLSK